MLIQSWIEWTYLAPLSATSYEEAILAQPLRNRHDFRSGYDILTQTARRSMQRSALLLWLSSVAGLRSWSLITCICCVHCSNYEVFCPLVVHWLGLTCCLVSDAPTAATDSRPCWAVVTRWSWLSFSRLHLDTYTHVPSIGRVGAFRPEGREFESRSSRHVGTLGSRNPSLTVACSVSACKLRHTVSIVVVGSASKRLMLWEALSKYYW